MTTSVIDPKARIMAEAKTRLLIFTNSVAVGGMEEHVKLLTRHIDRSQFEVFVVCPKWQPTKEFNQILALTSDHLLEITPDRRHGLRQELKEVVRLYRQLRTWRIDVAHLHSTTYRGQFLAFLAAKLAGVKRIFVTEHLAPEAPLSWPEYALRNLFSLSVSGIVCVSQKNYEARLAHLYTPKKRTVVINNGVDLDDFPPIAPDVLAELRTRHNLPEDALIVGSVVRLEAEKGLQYLISAMVEIRQAFPTSYLLIVGDGKLREQLEAQIAELGLTEYVRLVGFQANPRPYFGLMDAFVLPVPVGSMSIGLLEAMAIKKAVVITFGGTGEAVVNGENGFCAEPRNPQAIAQAVVALLRDPQLREKFGEAARRRVAQDFSAVQVARHLEQLYRAGMPPA